MSAPNGKTRKTKYTDYQRWVGLPHFMLKSPAWKTMTPNAKALLIEVWARFNGTNNGDISYSVREGEAIGLSVWTASRAFHELIDRGFLQVKRNASFTLKTKEARTWTITALPMPDGTKASLDFMRWRPAEKTNHSSASLTDSSASLTVTPKTKGNYPLQ